MAAVKTHHAPLGLVTMAHHAISFFVSTLMASSSLARLGNASEVASLPKLPSVPSYLVMSGPRDRVLAVSGVCGSGLSSAWASWPMPNPTSSGLPNLAHYTTTQTTIQDTVTCLEWQRSPAPATYTWAQAKAYCTSLNLNGGGWHLPSRIELTSIVDFTRSGPAIDISTFPGTPAAFFWTSSVWVVQSSIPRAWIINFYEGLSSNGAFQSGSYRVRCVRSPGGSGRASYVNVGQGQVQDVHTGLIWQSTGSAAKMSRAEAGDMCRGLTLGGKKWRLPSIKELATTVDEGRVAPAIDLSIFPGTASKGWYWSSSGAAPSAGATWALNYEDGYTNYRNINAGYVRCVR